jgi:hypothetical protein
MAGSAAWGAHVGDEAARHGVSDGMEGGPGCGLPAWVCGGDWGTWQAGATGRLTSKYRAVSTVVDGIRFHSKGEAARYMQLRLLEKAGHISALVRQPAFPLHVVGNDDLILIGKYVADFGYVDEKAKGKPLVFEDFKGMDTPLSKWKRKHCEAEYGIEIWITR